MLKERRKATHFLFFLVLSLHAAGFEKPETTSIQIGMLAPLMGARAPFGESRRNGVQMAIDEINSQGGLNGRKLELVIADTKTDPPMAVTSFLRRSEKSDIVAIIGSAVTLLVP